MTIQFDKTNVIQHFESLADFGGYLDEGKVQPIFKDKQHSKKIDWTGYYLTKSWDEAQNLLAYGDYDNYNKVTQDSGYIDPNCLPDANVTGWQRTKTYSGGALSVGAYLGGSCNCFSNRRKMTTPTRFVTINFCITDVSRLDANQKVSAGVKLLSAVRVLEQNKIRCRINLAHGLTRKVYGSSNLHQFIGFTVNVKSEDAPLDEIMLTYPLCNASMERRQCDRWIEITPGVCRVKKDHPLYGYLNSLAWLQTKFEGCNSAIAGVWFNTKNSMMIH